MDSDWLPGIDRRRLLGLAAAGVVAGASLIGGQPSHADPADADIPPDCLPGGAYDRYVADLAAHGKFAGANPGVGANWSNYPYTGWDGVVLGNIDGLPLADMIDQQDKAVIGQS
jgi:hypothetical protein